MNDGLITLTEFTKQVKSIEHVNIVVVNYNTHKIADGNVIMYDGTSCLIYSKLGVKQFEGTTEYEIKEVIPVFGINKYLVMNADGLAEVRLVK